MGMGHWRGRLLPRLESAFAWLGYTFVNRWGAVERGYRRPYARIALRLGFAFYPLLALVALGWLAWDWNHGRSLASAENAIFDQVIKLRPWEPKPSGKVVVAEIDDCSIEYYRGRGEGGWPWSRQRHADLLDIEGDSATLGKTAGKDIAQDKATFPSLLGIDASRARLAALRAVMSDALAPFGDRVDTLAALGREAIERDR